MNRILITGATGNIGAEVIHYLFELNVDSEIIAGVRNIEKSKHKLQDYPQLKYCHFDFEDFQSFEQAFTNIDVLFLLRPPHISDIEKYFNPLLKSAKKHGVENIVFLSVQGAEKSKVIPHNKIEHLIKAFDFNYIFVRPSYFMQNLTTTLLPEIQKHKTITLPSGNAKFNWIDVKNIGEATAQLIMRFSEYKNKAYEITGTENENFVYVTNLLSKITSTNFTYKSVNPISFYFKKKKSGLKKGFAMVMTILHYLPRLQKEPKISNNYTLLTGKESTTLSDFIYREKNKLNPINTN